MSCRSKHAVKKSRRLNLTKNSQSKSSIAAPKPTINTHVYFDDDGNIVADVPAAGETGKQANADGNSGNDVIVTTPGVEKTAEFPAVVTVDDSDDEGNDEFLTADEYVVDIDDDDDDANKEFFEASELEPTWNLTQVKSVTDCQLGQNLYSVSVIRLKWKAIA